MRRILALLFALAAPAAGAFAQVTIAPVFLAADDRQPMATVLVANPGLVRQEIVLDLLFGYDASDSLGNRYVEYADSASAALYDLARFTKVFPQRFVLEPKQEQVVRLMVKAPKGLTPGVYWTRLAVRSRDQHRPGHASNAAVSARVAVEVSQVIPVVFRHGPAETTVAMSNLDVRQDASALTFEARLHRSGGTPFFGSSVLRVYDAEGRAVETVRRPVSVYFDYVERFHFAPDRFDAGRYTAELMLIPERPDVSEKLLPTMARVSGQAHFEIPQ